METKTPKAQIEVWEWKEKAYNLIKDLPVEKQIPFIIKSAKSTITKLKDKKKIKKNIS